MDILRLHVLVTLFVVPMFPVMAVTYEKKTLHVCKTPNQGNFFLEAFSDSAALMYFPFIAHVGYVADHVPSPEICNENTTGTCRDSVNMASFNFLQYCSLSTPIFFLAQCNKSATYIRVTAWKVIDWPVVGCGGVMHHTWGVYLTRSSNLRRPLPNNSTGVCQCTLTRGRLITNTSAPIPVVEIRAMDVRLVGESCEAGQEMIISTPSDGKILKQMCSPSNVQGYTLLARAALQAGGVKVTFIQRDSLPQQSAQYVIEATADERFDVECENIATTTILPTPTIPPTTAIMEASPKDHSLPNKSGVTSPPPADGVGGDLGFGAGVGVGVAVGVLLALVTGVLVAWMCSRKRHQDAPFGGEIAFENQLYVRNDGGGDGSG